MPNGNGLEQKQFDWEKQAAQYGVKLEESSEHLGVLQTELQSLYKPGKMKLVSKPWEPAKWEWIPLPEDAGAWGTFVGLPGGIMEISAKQDRVNAIKAEITLLSVDVAKNEFYVRLYTVIPIGIMGEEIFTVEDALDVVRPPSNISRAELTNIENVIQNMLGVVELPVTEVEGLIEAPPLVAPTGLVVPPSSIHTLTVDAIIRNITTLVVPPQTLPDSEWQDLLNKSYPEYADMTMVEIRRAEAQRIIAESKRINEAMAGFQTAIAEMPEYKLTDFLRELILQPGLAMLEVGMQYFEKVSQPIAAQVYKTFIPDIEALYQRHRLTEDSDWSALQKAWEEWDAPFSGVPEFLIKYMLMETLTDPLTWLSVFTLGTSMVSATTGKFARFAGVLNKANRVIFAPFEAPFTAGKWLIGNLPKTISQKAAVVEGVTGRVIKQYMERLSKGRLLNKGMTMQDWERLANRAIRYAFNNPGAADDIAEAGRALLKHKPVTTNDVVKYAENLGNPLTKEEITPKMVGDINTIFEAMFQKYLAKTGKLMTPAEAGKRLLDILGLGGSDDKTFKAARKILEGRAAAIIDNAKSFSKLVSPGKALQGLMRRNFDYHIAIERSIDEMALAQSNRFNSFYANIEAKFVAVWQKYVEEIAIRPLAQSYLTFAMYGPMNVIEDHWRSILGGVFPRRMTTDRMGIISHGLSIDPDMINPSLAMSEAIGRLRRHGGDDQWNNWILQLGTLGQKDWADKLYTGLVRLPGGFGMDIRRNFVGEKYLVLFKEMGGEFAEILIKAEGRPPKLGDNKLVRELRQAVYDAKTTLDLDAIRNVKDLFTRKSIYRKEVQNIMKEHPDLPNTVRDFLLESFDDNTLYADGVRSVQARMKEANTRLVDSYLKGGEYATKQFQELMTLLTGLEVRNPEEMAHLLLNLNAASEIYGKAPEELLAQATIASQGYPLAERRARFDKVFDDILEFRNKAGGNLEQLIEKLRVDLKAGKTFNQEYSIKVGRLFDLLTSKKQLSDQFRLEDMAWRHEIFAGVEAKEMNDDWWQAFYRQARQRIHNNQVKLVGIEGDIMSAIQESNLSAGIKPFSRKAIKVVDRPLAPQDIANLVGCQGDDLSRALLDNLTIINDRGMFIEYITRQVRPGDEGFTKEAIGNVFDQISHAARVKPGAINWVTSKQMELEAVRGDLHNLWNSKLLPDDEIKEIARYVDDTVEAVRGAMYEPEPITASLEREYEQLFRIANRSQPDNPAVKLFGEHLNQARSTAGAAQRKALIGVEKLEDEVRQIAGRAVKPPKPREVMKAKFQNLQEVRQQAMDEAHKWYYKEFTDYTNANAFDAIMKGIFPFWTYESQRWFWVPRSFVRHPGTFTALERWQDNTDYGYIPVAGTSIEVNPFRGTVYGPLTTRLTRRDYPEYYDAWEGAEPINEYFDWLSRYGAYLGGHLTILMSLFGGLEAQTGEALPPIWESPLMILQSIAPDNDFVKLLTDHIFSDRFRTYMTIQEVTARGGNGALISAKLRENKPLTEEEQAMWDEARRPTGLYSLLFENTGLFRLRHSERKAVYEAATNYITEKYGYTEEQQKWLRMHGHRVWDQIGGMSLEDQRVLEELEYFRYTGMVDRLLPGRQQLVLDKLTLAWDNVEKFVDSTIERKTQLEREFRSGDRGPEDYNDQLRRLYTEQSEFIYNEMRDMVDEPIPEGLTKEEERAFVKEHSVMELEGRKRYYEKWQIPLPVLHPLRELLNLYYSIELREIHDPETGELIRDWDTFWSERMAVEESIPDMWKDEFKDYITKNETRMESIRREIYQRYFTKYWWVWDQVLGTYNEDEQKLIREYLSLENRGINISRQAEIQAIQSQKTGNVLISSFRSEVSDARKALRYANPHLDAWLYFWGRTSSFIAPGAEETYKQIAKDTGRQI